MSTPQVMETGVPRPLGDVRLFSAVFLPAVSTHRVQDKVLMKTSIKVEKCVAAIEVCSSKLSENQPFFDPGRPTHGA